MLSGGDQVVARAFGRRGRQDGRRDLQEIVFHHGLPHGGDDLRAQDDVLLDRGVAQIEETVFQTLRLIRLTASVDLEGQRVVAAFAEDLHFLGHHFDIAGGKLRVLAGALAHLARHLDGGLLVHALEDLKDRRLLGHKLRGAVEVAQNHKSEIPADHPDVFHESGQRHRLSHMLHAELSAGMRSHLHHNCLSVS